MADLAPLKYGKCVGRYLVNIADGPDIGDGPEFLPMAGVVTFTAEVPKVLVATAQPDPATYVQLPEHYVAPLDEFGYLTWRGQRGIRLVAPGPETNPPGWTWRVEFDLSYDGKRIPIAPFSFEVTEFTPGPDPEDPDTGSFGLVDLTLVSPVPSTPGVGIVRGEPGEGLHVDRRVLTYADLPAEPAEGDGAQYIVAADHMLYIWHTGTGWMPEGQGVVVRGPQGATGATGDPGPANELTIGTVLTGTPGSAASASISGAPPNQVLGLVIPRGDPGATGPSAPDATTSAKGIIQLAGHLAGTAGAPALSAAAFGTSASTACRGDDARLSDPRPPSTGTSPYDMSITVCGKDTVRAVGTGDFPHGVRLARAVTFTEAIYRGVTPDGSGNLVVELRKNGAAVSGSSATVASGSQVVGGTATGTFAYAAGDILTVQMTGVGTGPGKGLQVDLKGTA